MQFNINDLFGKFSEFQAQMQRVKQSLESILVEGEAGGGMVRVTCSANRQIKQIRVEPDVMNDREMMEDLIVAATNLALAHASERAAEEMAKVTQGMMPPGMMGGMDLSQFGL